MNLKNYRMPSVLKGADLIIEHTLSDKPDFNHPDALIGQLIKSVSVFINDIEELLREI